MVRKISWKKYQKERATLPWCLLQQYYYGYDEQAVLYLCWHQFCQQKICICNKWVPLWRLDVKWETQYLESYAQNHTNMSHSITVLIQHLVKLKCVCVCVCIYIYIYIYIIVTFVPCILILSKFYFTNWCTSELS